MNIAKPVLQKTVPPALLPPFVIHEHVYETLAEVPSLGDRQVISPSSSWTRAKKGKSGNTMPQAIAHRGYKAKCPENTLAAFKGAVDIGAHALETDVHLSRDDVVVLSHDPSLNRCFGVDEKIRDRDWSYISTLRTKEAPHEPMPRLRDLLDYLAQPGLEHVWLLLDIKISNNAADIMRLIGSTLENTSPSPSNPWSQRIVLGIWAAKFLPLCIEYLPSYAISNIGFSIPYARQFLHVPNMSFNILQKALMGPRGSKFIRDVKEKRRPLYVWTVNEEYFMRWSISKGVDGVITDDPKRFLEVCDAWEKGDRKLGSMTWLQLALAVWFNFMIMVFGAIFRWSFGGGRKAGEQIRRAVELKGEAR